LAPENTIPAFRKALDLGVTTLELDVVISQDGEVVVSHEPWMSHVICTAPDGSPVEEGTAADHNLYEMTYEEIAAYDCGSRAHPRFPEQELQPVAKPLLRDVIQMAEAYAAEQRDEPIFYNIETKIRPKWEGTFTPGPEAFADAVLGVIREEDVAARATVQSFDPRTLIVAHARQEESGAVPVRLALLIASSMDNGVNGNLQMLPFTPDIYSPDHTLVDADLIAAAHEKGMLVIPWTVNDPADMDRLVDLGVDGLITDYPNRFGD
jgi:glycerophosphoryl diester phosphodiesterase